MVKKVLSKKSTAAIPKRPSTPTLCMYFLGTIIVIVALLNARQSFLAAFNDHKRAADFPEMFGKRYPIKNGIYAMDYDDDDIMNDDDGTGYHFVQPSLLEDNYNFVYEDFSLGSKQFNEWIDEFLFQDLDDDLLIEDDEVFDDDQTVQILADFRFSRQQEQPTNNTEADEPQQQNNNIIEENNKQESNNDNDKVVGNGKESTEYNSKREKMMQIVKQKEYQQYLQPQKQQQGISLPSSSSSLRRHDNMNSQIIDKLSLFQFIESNALNRDKILQYLKDQNISREIMIELVKTNRITHEEMVQIFKLKNQSRQDEFYRRKQELEHAIMTQNNDDNNNNHGIARDISNMLTRTNAMPPRRPNNNVPMVQQLRQNNDNNNNNNKMMPRKPQTQSEIAQIKKATKEFNLKTNGRIMYFLHIHKSGGLAICHLARMSFIPTSSKKNCFVQDDQRCCGGSDTLQSQIDFARNTQYRFVASEGDMYEQMAPDYYIYVMTLRDSQNRYRSHWSQLKHGFGPAGETVMGTFSNWWKAQPDNWTARKVCGTHCQSIPKYQLSQNDFNYIMKRMDLFQDFIFVETFDDSYGKFAQKWGWTGIPPEHARDSRQKQVALKQADWDPLMSAIDDALYDYAKRRQATTTYNNNNNNGERFSPGTLARLKDYFEKGPSRQCTNPCCAPSCSRS